MNKRRSSLLAAAVVFAGLGIHWSRAAEDQPQPVSIEKLLERIVELEARVAKLEKNPPVKIVPLAAERLPAMSQPSVPSDWIPNSINGQTFYYVLLGTAGAVPAGRK